MKNITSKLIALGLTGALAVVSFTACSKAKETTAETTVFSCRKAVKMLFYDYAVSRSLSMRFMTALISFSDGISNIPIAVK